LKKEMAVSWSVDEVQTFLLLVAKYRIHGSRGGATITISL